MSSDAPSPTSSVAPLIWVCSACGKTSPDRYGRSPETMRGWDESCFLRAVACHPEGIKRDEDGRVKYAVALPANPETARPNQDSAEAE